MTAARERASALMRLTLVEACEAVRKGEVTAVALTEAALDAFKAGDATINASVALEPEEALQTAERLDRMRKAGRLLGPLHGVPLAHKDMYYRADKPCRCGSKIRDTFRPTYTATAIKRLEDAGSITIGSLNMAEFAQNPTGHNCAFRRLPQPLACRLLHGRLLVGVGRGGRRPLHLWGARVGHRRLHPAAGDHVRRNRHQGHADARVALRRHAALLLRGQRWAACADSPRLRAAASHHRRP